jgi:bifunctional UDP-N-acetylglucosamine pyrophosphorylase/glucosamine-1-phosphate N-acetyltransferase
VVVSDDADGDLVSSSFSQFSPLEWPRQKEQRGTADAVAAALPALAGVQGEVLILCGDVPLLRPETLLAFQRHHRAAGAGLSVLTAVLDDGGSYGRVLLDDQGSPTAIVEARDASSAELEVRRINSGTYLVDLELLRQALTATDCDNAQGEYYLTDMVAFARRHGVKVSCLDVDDPDEILGVNTRADLVHLESLLAGRIAERWLGRGVTIRSPETVRIGPRVRLDPEVEIEPGAALFGEVTIGRGSLIGTGAQLQDTWVGAGVEIKAYSVLEEAAVAAGAQIGPFARLRPGTEIGPDAKIGNFVETKKAVFGRGAKASHLAYIGDAEVGEESNLGAGTITCNYDGFMKHRTEIGEGAFIGSNTMLVAPVKIGNEAMTATGSVINKDVPDGALALARARQETKPGMARKLFDKLKKTKARRAKEAK